MAIDVNRINPNALAFFLAAVEECRVRTRYYNGEKKLYGECVKQEAKQRKYMNKVLAMMRESGMENVPEDIPERVYKKKKAKEVLASEQGES